MRRFWITILVGAMAVAMLLPAVATADPPDCNYLPLDHPKYCGPSDCMEIPTDHPEYCGTPVPTTTPTTEPPAPLPCPDPIELSGTDVLFECDWAPMDNGVEEGEIAVMLNPGDVARRFVVMVQDSSPGDYCELSWDGKRDNDSEWWEGRLSGNLVLTFPLADGRGIYWNFGYDPDDPLVRSHGEHWCEPYDPVDGLREDLNGDPLHLRVIMRSTKGAEVTIDLSPPQDS